MVASMNEMAATCSTSDCAKFAHGIGRLTKTSGQNVPGRVLVRNGAGAARKTSATRALKLGQKGSHATVNRGTNLEVAGREGAISGDAFVAMAPEVEAMPAALSRASNHAAGDSADAVFCPKGSGSCPVIASGKCLAEVLDKM